MKTNGVIIECETPVHDYFGLTYAQYLVLPRTALQSMPVEWQERFIKCLEQLDANIDWRPEQGQYWVTLRAQDGKYLPIDLDPLMDYERGRRMVPLKEDHPS